MNAYLESFLPLFVAINVPGILPVYLAVTERLNAAERRRLTLQAVATASLLSVLILFAESMVALVLADALLEKLGGDSMTELRSHWEATLAQQRAWPDGAR